jgi:phospholipase C
MTEILTVMISHYLCTFIIIVFFIFLLTALLNEYFTVQPAAAAPNSDTRSVTPIKHVVVISQGARSFDNYFGTFPGANGIPYNITLPLNPFTPASVNFAVAAWFNTNKTFPSKGILVNKGGLGVDIPGKNMNYGIWMNVNGTVTGGFETRNGTDHYISSADKYNDGKWHQVVVTYDSKSSLSLFMDGNKSASTSTAGEIPDTTGIQQLIVGANSLHRDNFFSGYIDEVRIWNRTLGYSEVLNGYRNNDFNTDKQFVYLSFDDGKTNAAGANANGKSVQLKGTYFNGSSYQDVKSNLPEYTTYLKPFHLEETKTDRLYFDSKGYKMSYNNGLMNGFASAQHLNGADAGLVMGYYNEVELPYYWNFASGFVLSDNFFAPTMKTGLINELYLYTGGPGQYQKNISLNGYNRTILNELQMNGLSWKVYAEDYIQVLNRSSYVKEKGETNILTALAKSVDNQTLKSNFVYLSEYFRDINSDNFPAVAYIIAPTIYETAPKDASTGQEVVAALVLALMKSKHWNDSVFIITYRESGGWYDHVPPPSDSNQSYGFRVPTLIISPFSKKGFVDSTLYDATSILKFIEYNYGMQPLSTRDANANNLLNAFDFTKPPRKPIYLEEISRERLLIKTVNVSGVNTVYFFSLLAPVAVTIGWYYRKQKVSSKYRA